MQLSKDISDKLSELVTPITEALGLELVEISLRNENQRNILGIIIDKDSGVTVDDCAKVSNKVSLVLDVEDIIQHKYYLEVGSPGIFRELKTEKDFLRNLGKRVKAVFKEPVEGEIQFVGLLGEFKDNDVTLRDGEQGLTIALERIKKIQLFPDI